MTECPNCDEGFEQYREEWEVRGDGFEDLVKYCPHCGSELDRVETDKESGEWDVEYGEDDSDA